MGIETGRLHALRLGPTGVCHRLRLLWCLLSRSSTAMSPIISEAEWAESNGAEERTRTSKGLLPLAPEASASASSATSASKNQVCHTTTV